MAQIKMDISEYDEMKKNAALLEEALKREKAQSEKIEALKQEKIDVLKANEKSVTIVKKSQVTEYLLQKRSTKDILNRLSDFYRRAKMGALNTMSSIDNELSTMTEVFFDRSKSYSNVEEEVTLKGLEEVKSDIRRELQSRLDKEIKDKLNRLEVVERDLKTTKSKLSETSYELRIAHNKNESVIKTKDEAVSKSEELEETIKELNKKGYKLTEGLQRPFNYFNAYSRLKELRKI